MYILLLIIVAAYVFTSITWIHYLAIMHLRKHRHELTLGSKIFGYPALIV